MNLLIVYLIKWQKTVENLRTSSQTLFIFRLLDASVYFDIFTFLMYKFVVVIFMYVNLSFCYCFESINEILLSMNTL